MTRAFAVALGLVLLAVARPGANGVSARPVNAWTTDPTITAAATANGLVYLAGNFTAVGLRTGAMAVIDRTTHERMPWPTFSGGPVTHVMKAPDGGYLVQGSFREVDGRPVNGLVRLTGDGAFDPAFVWTYTGGLDAAFLAGNRLVVTAGTLSALVDWQTGRLLAGPLPFAVKEALTGPGGAIVAWACGAACGLVELNATTGAIDRVMYTAPCCIWAVTLTSTHAFLAIPSSAFSGVITSVDLQSGVATPIATVTGQPISPTHNPPAVQNLVHHRGRLYLQGGLGSVNGTVIPYAPDASAAIDARTGVLTAWRRPDTLWGARIVVGDGDRLLCDSSNVGPMTGPLAERGAGLLALDAETGADTGWRLRLLAGTPSAAIVLEPSRLVIGGAFSGVATVFRSGLAAVSLPDGAPTAWAPQSDVRTTQIAVYGTRVFVLQGTRDIVEYDATTGARGPWHAVTSDAIARMVVDGTRLFIAGRFSAVDGVPRNGAASFDLSGAAPALEAWTSPLMPSAIQDLEVAGNVVFLAGNFEVLAIGAQHQVIAIDAVTGVALPWFPSLRDADGSIGFLRDVAATAGRVVLAGRFDVVDGVPRPGLAALEVTGHLLPWPVDDVTAIGTPSRLAVFEDFLYAGGEQAGQATLIEFALPSGRRTAWTPHLAQGRSDAGLLSVPGAGLLRHVSAGDGTYWIHPRILTVAAVSGLQGAVSGSRVHLSWDMAVGADRYVIEAGSSPGQANLAVVDTGSTATTFSADVPNGRYHVRVRGANEGGTGPPSQDLVVVVGEASCVGPPNVPRGLQATTSGLTATLNWEPPSGGQPVAHYAIDLVTGSGSPATLAHVVGTTFIGSGPAGRYAVAVRSENACGTSVATPPVSVTLGLAMR